MIWLIIRWMKKIIKVFNGLIQDIYSKSSFKISTRDDQTLINMIHARVGQEKTVLGLIFHNIKFYTNKHNFWSDRWTRPKFYQKTSDAIFSIGLNFCSNQNLKRSCDKDQKLLYENCIIFLVGLRLSFLLIYEFSIRQVHRWQQVVFYFARNQNFTGMFSATCLFW